MADYFRNFRVPFLKSIPDDKYTEFVDQCTIREFAAGDVVFHQGDSTSTEFYMMIYGEVELKLQKMASVFGSIDGGVMRNVKMATFRTGINKYIPLF